MVPAPPEPPCLTVEPPDIHEWKTTREGCPPEFVCYLPADDMAKTRTALEQASYSENSWTLCGKKPATQPATQPVKP